MSGDALRVVVVDDNDGFRLALRALLASEGIEVVGEAGEGQAALDTVLTAQPDVALVDLGLPGCSGAEVVSVLVRSTRVVVLSGSSEQADVKAALDAGARGYVVKGSDPADLCAAIRAAAV